MNPPLSHFVSMIPQLSALITMNPQLSPFKQTRNCTKCTLCSRSDQTIQLTHTFSLAAVPNCSYPTAVPWPEIPVFLSINTSQEGTICTRIFTEIHSRYIQSPLIVFSKIDTQNKYILLHMDY